MEEVVAYVQTTLRQAGIETTLSGGSCVTFWAGNDFRSDDLDLISDGFHTRRKIRGVMMALGFREDRRYFVHDETIWFIEFPEGPLAVGEERPRSTPDVQLATGVMRLLSPSDCIKDRLAGWFYYSDQQCLRQALAVAQAHKVDWDEIERWAVKEGKRTQFAEFKRQLPQGT